MNLTVQELQEVARSRDSERRREMLGAVAELFLAGDSQKSNRESTLFSDIFLRTIDDLDKDGQIAISEQLAASAGTPKVVGLHLACSEAEVADPMLRLSPVLDEGDLVRIASEMSNDHLVSISQRAELSENVTDVLIDRGDGQVRRNVTANDGARISHAGFEALAGHAHDDSELQSSLAGRLDTPEEIINRILPKVSGDVAQRVRSAFASSIDKQAMGKAFASAEAAFAGAKLESSRARVEALVHAKQIERGKADIDSVVAEMAGEEKFLELVTVMGRLVDLPEHLVTELMFMAENAPFIIMCRSIGMSRDAFVAFSGLRCRRLKLPSSHADHAVAEFDAISHGLARRFVRFVNLRRTL